MKRCYNKTEAMQYLGVRRRFFDENIMPLLKDKAVKAGPSLVFERSDLDSAWDNYKLTLGSERVKSKDQTCDVQHLEASTRRKTALLTLIHNATSSEFESAVSKLLTKQKSI